MTQTPWTLTFDKKALKEFQKLDKSVKERIAQYFQKNIECANDPRDLATELKYELYSYWRFRVGNYRLVCLFDDDAHIIEVYRVEHRSDVYKSKI